jgi:Trp operon repressor
MASRRQRCRQARYQRYTKVHELHRGGHTQLEIAEKVGIGAETVASANEFQLAFPAMASLALAWRSGCDTTLDI